MLQLVGIAKRDSADVNRSRDVYGRSLGALQKALNHPVAWKATETLAATVICCVYEVSIYHRADLVVPRGGAQGGGGGGRGLADTRGRSCSQGPVTP